MIKQTYILLFLFLFSTVFGKQPLLNSPSDNCNTGDILKTKETPLYKDPSAPVEKRVNDLIGRMTTEEKIGQLSCLLGWEMYSKEDSKIILVM